MTKAIRILIEGIDGAGKTSACDMLEHILSEQSIPMFRMREPGSTPLAEYLRGELLTGKFSDNPELELLLFSAARASSNTVIVDEISKGRVVLCDRGSPTTYAYQVLTSNTRAMWNGLHTTLEPKVPTIRILLTCDFDTMAERKSRAAEFNGLDARLASPEAFARATIAYRELDWDLIIPTDGLSTSEVVSQILPEVYSMVKADEEKTDTTN